MRDDFIFSQSSLQDFADCPRRFQLRYVAGQPWPAVQTEPLLERERLAERGSRFHRLVQRHQVGIPADRLQPDEANDPELAAWWAEYLRFEVLHALPGRRYVEHTLVTALEGLRLSAKYDLLIAEPDGRHTIFDWKTVTRHPGRRWFESRLQTLVYPYVLARAGRAPSPEAIRLVYWLPAHPADPVIFDYSQAQFERDEARLASLFARLREKLADASSSAIPAWTLTDDERQCQFCEYRSLCDRGITAGIALDEVIDQAFDSSDLLGLSNVEEVGF